MARPSRWVRRLLPPHRCASPLGTCFGSGIESPSLTGLPSPNIVVAPPLSGCDVWHKWPPRIEPKDRADVRERSGTLRLRAESYMCNRVALLAGILGLVASLLLLAGKESQSVDAIHQPTGDPIANQPVAPPQPATQEPPTNDSYCQTCHSDESLSSGFSNGQALSLHVDTRVVRDSAHELLTCVTCHDQLGTHPDENPPLFDITTYRTGATEMCERCHQSAADGYAVSAHSDTVVEEGDGATCIDCHSPDGSGHSVAPTSDQASLVAPASIAGACGRCHERALSTYEQTSHGKLARFGDARTTATCISCHDDHDTQTIEELTTPA